MPGNQLPGFSLLYVYPAFVKYLPPTGRRPVKYGITIKSSTSAHALYTSLDAYKAPYL